MRKSPGSQSAQTHAGLSMAEGQRQGFRRLPFDNVAPLGPQKQRGFMDIGHDVQIGIRPGLVVSHRSCRPRDVLEGAGAVRFGHGAVSLAHDGRGGVKAPFVLFDGSYFPAALLAVRHGLDDDDGRRGEGGKLHPYLVAGPHAGPGQIAQIVLLRRQAGQPGVHPHGHAVAYRAHLVFPVTDGNEGIAACLAQLFGPDARPRLRPGHPQAGMSGGGAVVSPPLVGQSLQFAKVADIAEAQAALKLRLDDVFHDLDRTGGAGRSCGVMLQLDAEPLAELAQQA